MDYLELALLTILQQHRRVFGALALAYRARQKPEDKIIREFEAIPQIALWRASGEYSDLEIGRATTNVIEHIIEKMETP